MGRLPILALTGLALCASCLNGACTDFALAQEDGLQVRSGGTMALTYEVSDDEGSQAAEEQTAEIPEAHEPAVDSEEGSEETPAAEEPAGDVAEEPAEDEPAKSGDVISSLGKALPQTGDGTGPAICAACTLLVCGAVLLCLRKAREESI